jgi:hypothetical protein
MKIEGGPFEKMKGARGRAKDGTRMCVNMIKVYYIDK